MTITLVALAAMMATLVVWLLRQTFNVKPWVAQDQSVAAAPSAAFPSLPPVKIGLVVFLAVVTSLFALFISAYSMRMAYADWRALPEPVLLWLNSGILVLGSVGLQWAWSAAKRGRTNAMRFGLIAGGVCAIAFVAGQLLAWQQLTASGYFVSANPANAFFYVITGLHALHLLGGLVAWGRTVTNVWWRGFDASQVRLSVELCAVYWHYLLVVWLVLFSLLLST